MSPLFLSLSNEGTLSDMVLSLSVVCSILPFSSLEKKEILRMIAADLVLRPEYAGILSLVRFAGLYGFYILYFNGIERKESTHIRSGFHV